MPYIGKSPVGGGFHKLDSLTASATATYALTLGSAAYFPETANQLLVSLNGVIQAPQDSFTVSGSNLVFDSALTSNDSIDFVVALGDVLGVQGVTDGAVTTAKIANQAVTMDKLATSGTLPALDGSALTGVSTPVYLTRFGLTSNLTSDGTLTNWAAPSISNQVATINPPVTVSSGLFTFPVTGVWRVHLNSRVVTTTDGTLAVVLDLTTDNGSNYTQTAFASEGDGASTTNTGSIVLTDYINVNDVSNVKVRLIGSSIASGGYIQGVASGSSGLRTWVSFERITDAQ